MARYRKIDPRIWNDAKFMELSDDGKLLFFMLLTHPHMTAVGAMRSTAAGLAEELDWDYERLSVSLSESLSKGLVKADRKGKLIWLPNFLKYNSPESPNVLKAWINSFELLPECDLKLELFETLKDFVEGLTEGFRKAFSEAFGLPFANQEQEQEQEQDINNLPKGKSSARAKKPPCPHEEIISVYHESLPNCPTVREWNQTRKSYLRSRWNEKPERQDVEWWKKFFVYVGESDFLTGRTEGKNGQPPFVANLEWLVRPTNFAKIIEGNYHR